MQVYRGMYDAALFFPYLDTRQVLSGPHNLTLGVVSCVRNSCSEFFLLFKQHRISTSFDYIKHIDIELIV